MPTAGPGALAPADRLATRTYLGLLAAQFLAAFNDQAIHAAAMFFAINTQTLSEAQAISLMPILFYAPWAIFCTLAGFCADRYSKTYSLVFWKISEIVIALIAMAGFWLGSVHGAPVGAWLVLSTVFLMGPHAAFFAPAGPIANVPTGTPPGICAMESSESSPLRACDSTGTPSTGRILCAATMPGRCAAPPAPAMMISPPRPSAAPAYSAIQAGVRWAETMRHSCGTLNSARISAECRIVSQSDASTLAYEIAGAKPVAIHVAYSPESGKLITAIDGEDVLVHEIGALVVAPSQVTVGENPIDLNVTEQRFTGRIHEVRRQIGY